MCSAYNAFCWQSYTCFPKILSALPNTEQILWLLEVGGAEAQVRRGLSSHQRLACWRLCQGRESTHWWAPPKLPGVSETALGEKCPSLERGRGRASYWDTSAMCLWRSVIQRSSSSSRSTSFTRASPMPLVSYLERGQPHKIHPVLTVLSWRVSTWMISQAPRPSDVSLSVSGLQYKH